MIGINTSLGALQALQLQVAARSDPSDNDWEELRARDTSSDRGQLAVELDLTIPRNLPDKLPKPHHIDFLSQMEAILTAKSEQETTSDLSTDAARLQALQIRQQLFTSERNFRLPTACIENFNLRICSNGGHVSL